MLDLAMVRYLATYAYAVPVILGCLGLTACGGSMPAVSAEDLAAICHVAHSEAVKQDGKAAKQAAKAAEFCARPEVAALVVEAQRKAREVTAKP